MDEQDTHDHDTQEDIVDTDPQGVGEIENDAPAPESESESADLSLAAKLEALLFYKGEPESYRSLARILGEPEEMIAEGVAQLAASLEGRGLALVYDETSVELRTSPAASELITSLRKDELTRDLGNAGAETLAIVLYKGPVSRVEIDHIRGVNSSFILRSLLIRGLIARVEDERSKRSYRFVATPDTLAHLGISERSQLPEYHVISSQLAEYIEERTEQAK